MKKTSRHDENLDYLAMTGRLSKTERTRPGAGKTYYASEKKVRPAGASLTPRDVPSLLAKALASGGPIAPGEAYEHFLAVLCDSKRFYAFHFIIAPGLQGGRRRAVLLSERTVNGLCHDSAVTQAYARRLVEYANALGTPRVMIEELSACCFLTQSLRHQLAWTDSRVQWPPTDETLRTQYLDNYSLAFDRYRQAQAAGAFQHPLTDLIAAQSKAMAPSKDADGRVYLHQPIEKMDRELSAICQVYMDEENERLQDAPGGSFLDCFPPIF